MKREDKDSTHRVKQEWVESVMANSSLTHATRIYAFGVYRHMYGIKDVSWPSARAIRAATGLNDGKFYKYNDALELAGYLEIERRVGTSNLYRLSLPAAVGGIHLPPMGAEVPPVEASPTPDGGTNTSKKTPMKASSEHNKLESVVASLHTDSNKKPGTVGNVQEAAEATSFTPNLEAQNYLVDMNGASQEAHVPPLGVTPDEPVEEGQESPYRYKGVLYGTVAAARRAERDDRALALAGDPW